MKCKNALVMLLLILLAGCTNKDTFEWHFQDCARFMRENKSSCRIIAVNDVARSVTAEGFVTKELIRATFDDFYHPKVGEIWRVHSAIDFKTAWFQLTMR